MGWCEWEGVSQLTKRLRYKGRRNDFDHDHDDLTLMNLMTFQILLSLVVVDVDSTVTQSTSMYSFGLSLAIILTKKGAHASRIDKAVAQLEVRLPSKVQSPDDHLSH